MRQGIPFFVGVDGGGANSEYNRVKNYPVVIIGGGASGLMLSSLLPSSSILIEKMSQCGLKLLITGNGQANITHDEEPRDFITHYYEKKNFVQHALYAFPPEGIREYFRERGVETTVRSDGRVFPSSFKSRDILSALLKTSGEIITGTPVLKVRKEGSLFITETGEESYSSQVLVIATGGRTYQKTGSTGDGYAFASAFGHRIITPRPALAPIRINRDTTPVEGVSVPSVTLTTGKKSVTDSIVFTRNGFSGPAAENISHWIDGKTELTTSFLESFDAQKLKEENGKGSVINTLSKLTTLPHSLLEFLFPFLRDKNNASVTKEEMRKIEDTLLSWRVTADTARTEEKAMVTKGGIDTSEINSRTFESKLVPGLYFTGEIIDVDGECGGYNLSFAFASAFLAAEDIRKRI